MNELEFIKLNDEPVNIDYRLNEESEDWDLGFTWGGWFYRLCDFIKCHNNPWVSDVFPAYIHAFESGGWIRPLYIELIGDNQINVYEQSY